jgi:hypothetical protein
MPSMAVLAETMQTDARISVLAGLIRLCKDFGTVYPSSSASASASAAMRALRRDIDRTDSDVPALRNDAPCAQPAGVRENDRAVLGNVFIEWDAGAAPDSLAVEEWEIAHILAVMLDKVEAQKIAVRVPSRRDNSSNRDKPSGPKHNRIAVNGEALGLDLLAAAAIVASRTVQSSALRLYKAAVRGHHGGRSSRDRHA